MSSIFSQTTSAFFNFATLSPLRDTIAFVSESAATKSSSPTSTLSLYSLVTKKTSVLTKSRGLLVAPSWSGDGKTILYLAETVSGASSTEDMNTVSVNTGTTKNLGEGIPIGLSYDGSEVIYDAADTRLHIKSGTTDVAVSPVLLLGSPAVSHPLITVAFSPDRQYVAIVGPTKTFLARIDWMQNQLMNQTLLSTAYESPVFNERDQLLLAYANGTADSYTPTATGFMKGATYVIPQIKFPATLLGWITSTQ